MADRKAIDLLSFASTVFPGDKGPLNIATQRLLETGVEFAVNARRCFEVDGAKQAISARRWEYQLDNSLKVESDLWRALNGIIHARRLDVHFADSPQRIFHQSTNVVALHFVYETDRYPETYVDVFGMAWAYLTFGNFAWQY
ncbi:hypothetical protein [Rhodosalinus sp. FB01]|uniref:hypothetical protein n=1 Tax=Rhodosalinus sp. FB01 TaxID=3239194 RepID=UPI003524EC5B